MSFVKQYALVPTLFLLLALSSFSQSQSDTTCFSRRWISLQKEGNETLFDKEFILKIHELVGSNELEIYSESRDNETFGQWYPIPEIEVFLAPNEIDTLYLNKRTDYLEFLVQSDIPLTDEYGDPMIKTLADGTQMYIYPPATVYPITLDDISEMRILEVRDESSVDTESMKPYGISICRTDRYHNRELFWIKLDELSNALKDTPSWIQFITDKKYKGFQYMQTSCYNDMIRY